MQGDTTLNGLSPRALDLIDVVQQLSLARDVETVRDIVRRAARRLTGADGATFVLRDGDCCHYVDEDAIAPLWKGQRFPLSACISGWSMIHRRPAVIEDIYADSRIPHDAYRPTFVKSLLMTPIRTLDPIGAIGNYWARPHRPTEAEIKLLQALADSTAVAMENVRVYSELEQRVAARTAELELANRNLLAAQQQADRVFTAYSQALPGKVLDGKYLLEEELGAGGFGAVFRGRHLVLDWPIAVKVFRPAAGNDSGAGLQRFLREGAAAARIQHPNAIRVFDSGVSSDGIAFLIMELLRGHALSAELAQSELPSFSRCAAIGAKVAEVLAAAHRQGIVHRDIKPENIFLHEDEDGAEVVKVVDFGIATFFGDLRETRSRRLTQTGECFGTPTYLAPERYVRGDDEDGRSDIFSLSAMLYEMISGGHSPWTQHQQLKMHMGVCNETEPLPLHGFRRDVPPALEALVRDGLSWKCADRPYADEFAARLAALAEALRQPSALELVAGAAVR